MKNRSPGVRFHGSDVLRSESIPSDWAWLDEIAGKFSDDFLAEGRCQPEMPSRPRPEPIEASHPPGAGVPGERSADDRIEPSP